MPRYPPDKLKKVGDLIAEVDRATAMRPKSERGTYRKAQESVVRARRAAESRAAARRITS